MVAEERITIVDRRDGEEISVAKGDKRSRPKSGSPPGKKTSCYEKTPVFFDRLDTSDGASRGCRPPERAIEPVMRAMRLDRATSSVRIPDAALDAIKNLGLGRDQVTLLIETMGIIVALSLGSAISADSAISFEQLIACDGWDKYRAPIVICFHFCLAQLIVFIVTLLAIGYVKDGDWFKFYTRAVLPSMLVNVGVFVFIHAELSWIMDVNAWCRKESYVSVLSGTSPDEATLLRRANDASTSIFTFWAYVAWFAYLPPVTGWVYGYASYLATQRALAKKAIMEGGEDTPAPESSRA
jgi:hypothetical protein